MTESGHSIKMNCTCFNISGGKNPCLVHDNPSIADVHHILEEPINNLRDAIEDLTQQIRRMRGVP